MQIIMLTGVVRLSYRWLLLLVKFGVGALSVNSSDRFTIVGTILRCHLFEISGFIFFFFFLIFPRRAM